MAGRVNRSGLQVAEVLDTFINDEALPGSGVARDDFWSGVASLVSDLTQRNRTLLERRDELQSQIDRWQLDRKGQPIDTGAYKAFLAEIGYLVDEGPDFEIATAGVDPEIATIAGPLLVVPVLNARFALNAENARWGSLYDAFYGTDIIPEDIRTEKGTSYNPQRGDLVVARVAEELDKIVPLGSGSHADDVSYFITQTGDTRITLFLRNYPNSSAASSPLGPFTITSATDKVDTRARARAIALQIENIGTSDGSYQAQNWKLGTFRLDIQPDGRR